MVLDDLFTKKNQNQNRKNQKLNTLIEICDLNFEISFGTWDLKIGI